LAAKLNGELSRGGPNEDQELALRSLLKIASKATLAQAAALMDNENVGALLVADQDKVLRIVTARDIVLRAGDASDRREIAHGHHTAPLPALPGGVLLRPHSADGCLPPVPVEAGAGSRSCQIGLRFQPSAIGGVSSEHDPRETADPMAKDVLDGGAVPLPVALAALLRCVWRSLALLAGRRLAQPTERIADMLQFADGSHAAIYRETVRTDAVPEDPVLLIVGFRLRWVRGWGHTVFRAESLLNTLLFAGFPGFASKLWLANDEHGLYRGVYQWNGATAARSYVRALWWALALVSDRGSIRAVACPGLRRDDVLADPSILDRCARSDSARWWHVTRVEEAQAAAQ